MKASKIKEGCNGGHGLSAAITQRQKKMRLHSMLLLAMAILMYKCKIIIETVDDKNPANSSQITPLHQAAFWGHFKVCEYIIERVKAKNPQDISRSTPLHRAAQYSHLQIYNLILDNVREEEENRRCGGGWTPKRLLFVYLLPTL